MKELSEMDKILTVKELQQDVATLLDYLYSLPESSWDLQHVRKLVMHNQKRFDENIVFYKTPVNTDEYVKLIYSKADVADLIATSTDKYTAVGKLELKDQYKKIA